MAFTRAIALRWYVAHDAGNEGEEDLTVGDDHTNVGHGKMGFLSETDGRWPWWECVPRPEDGGGCDGDESGGGDDDGDDDEDDPDGDDDDDEGPDDGDPDESEGPPACDPSTGEGCECDAPEPADSDLVCSPKTHRKTPRRISNTKVKRKLKKKSKKKKVKSKKKSKKGSVKKPKVRWGYVQRLSLFMLAPTHPHPRTIRLPATRNAIRIVSPRALFSPHACFVQPPLLFPCCLTSRQPSIYKL